MSGCGRKCRGSRLGAEVNRKEDLCPGDGKERKKVVGGKELEGWVKLKGMDKGLNCLKEAGVLGASSGKKEYWNGMSYADRG